MGTSVAVSTQWLFNFTFSLVTPYMIRSWGSYTFIFYALLDLIMATMSYLFVKETRGSRIEDMETIFNSRAAFDVDAVHRKTLEGEGLDPMEEVHMPMGAAKNLED